MSAGLTPSWAYTPVQGEETIRPHVYVVVESDRVGYGVGGLAVDAALSQAAQDRS
jgi:hypothetical protein